jgi:NADPH:quinone reductase-like Zn-dependent oxidoreductase
MTSTIAKPSAVLARAVPGAMEAAALEKFGPPQVLSLHTLPVLLPGPGEVLIELHAAGVGVWDAMVRDGSWRPFGPPKFPLVPGTDGAGIVVMKGPHVRRFDIGDRVWAYHYANPKGGFYAEYVAVDVEHVGSMPRRLDFAQAGAGATTGLTALQGIDDALRVHKDDTVLVFGATGGVGTLAIQFARRKRARVLATATGNDAAALAKKLGADGVFDARTSDAAGRLKALASEGIDAALVLAGSDALEACLDLVKTDGRIAYPNGVWPEPRPRRKIQVLSYDAEAGPRQFERLEHAAAESRLTVPIAEAFPLDGAAKAHERLREGRILGRIVLKIRRGSR